MAHCLCRSVNVFPNSNVPQILQCKVCAVRHGHPEGVARFSPQHSCPEVCGISTRKDRGERRRSSFRAVAPDTVKADDTTHSEDPRNGSSFSEHRRSIATIYGWVRKPGLRYSRGCDSTFVRVREWASLPGVTALPGPVTRRFSRQLLYADLPLSAFSTAESRVPVPSGLPARLLWASPF